MGRDDVSLINATSGSSILWAAAAATMLFILSVVRQSGENEALLVKWIRCDGIRTEILIFTFSDGFRLKGNHWICCGLQMDIIWYDMTMRFKNINKRKIQLRNYTGSCVEHWKACFWFKKNVRSAIFSKESGLKPIQNKVKCDKNFIRKITV